MASIKIKMPWQLKLAFGILISVTVAIGIYRLRQEDNKRHPSRLNPSVTTPANLDTTEDQPDTSQVAPQLLPTSSDTPTSSPQDTTRRFLPTPPETKLARLWIKGLPEGETITAHNIDFGDGIILESLLVVLPKKPTTLSAREYNAWFDIEGEIRATNKFSGLVESLRSMARIARRYKN